MTWPQDAITQIQNYLQTEFALLGVGLDKILESVPLSVQAHGEFDDSLFRSIAEDFLARVAAADVLIAALPEDHELLDEQAQLRWIQELQQENEGALAELRQTIEEARDCQQTISGAIVALSHDKLLSQQQRRSELQQPPAPQRPAGMQDDP